MMQKNDIDCGFLCIYEKLKDRKIYNTHYNIQYMKQILR